MLELIPENRNYWDWRKRGEADQRVTLADTPKGRRDGVLVVVKKLIAQTLVEIVDDRILLPSDVCIISPNSEGDHGFDV